MQLTHNILLGLLAVLFLVSGAMKLSGNPKGLTGLREISLGNRSARFLGLIEAVSAIGLIYAIRYPEELTGWLAILILWIEMGALVYAHSRANKMRSSAPVLVLLILLSIVLVIA